MTRAFKLALIGAHGVGKTTLAYAIASRLKARDVVLEVVHEVARRCPLPLNRETSVAAQSWILHTQIADELAALSRAPVLICDRSVLDNYVYLLLAAGTRPELEPLVEAHVRGYDLLVHVPITAPPGRDGVRATDPEFQRAVDDRLRFELTRRNLEALELAADDREHWVDTIDGAASRALGPTQLDLL